MSSDFEDIFIISSTDKKVAKAIGKALKKKLEPQEVWGKEEGYCAWCVNRKVSDPIWEEATDSQGDDVKYACCERCAVDRGVIDYNPQDCAHCTMVGAHTCEPCEGKWHS